MTLSDISKIIIQVRKNKNMTQQELADAIGVSRAMISNWESGRNPITLEHFLSLLEKFDIPASSVFDSDFTEKEVRLILSYRDNPQFQAAIDELLKL